ncbi:MAG: glutathione transporter permease [candidate division NC10 bacterium]|jgi:ABC-type dipeptide/oligopeptide/nickel transport system permease subunit|nr:glutathione transporter permease [candidate division NC10 bacterium]
MDKNQDSQSQGVAGQPAVDALTVVSGSARESRSLWSDARSRLLRNPVAMAGGAVAILLILVAVAAPYVAPYDPIHQDLANSLAGPSIKHLAGTDVHGRDIFSRIIHGTRISLRIGFLGMLLGCVVGVILGLVSGYYGGWADTIIMRLMDVQLAFPGLLVAICIIAIIGPGLENVILAVGIFSVPLFARVTRGQILSLKEQEFIVAARMMGAQDGRIMLSHLLPNAVAPLLVLCTLRIATAILTAASLSFLGLGAQPPIPEWGAMLSDGRAYLAIAPHVATTPGLAILITVLAFNLLGDGLRDALDPRLKA